MDTSMFGTTNHAEISVSQVVFFFFFFEKYQKTLLAIDAVCSALYEIEILQMKMTSCREVLGSQVSFMFDFLSTSFCRDV